MKDTDKIYTANPTMDLLWQWVCYLEKGGAKPWTAMEWVRATTPAK